MRLEGQPQHPILTAQTAPERVENPQPLREETSLQASLTRLPQDQYHGVARPSSLLGDHRIRLLNNVRDIVTAVEPLMREGDSNKDGRLSPSEFEALPAPKSDLSPEARFTQQALRQKLQHHWQHLDQDKNGLDAKDIARLQNSAMRPDPQTYLLAAVPVNELSLVESIRELPPVGPFQFKPLMSQSYTFESRHQTWDHHTPTLQSLTQETETLSLTLSHQNNIRVYHPQDLPEAKTLLQHVAEAASRLPAPLQRVVHAFELNPLPYTFEVQEGAITRQADMTASPGGKITLYPQERSPESFYRTLIHESAHLLAFEKMGEDTQSPAWKNWLTAMEQDRLAPSQYARVNGSEEGIEDFAEAVTAWVLSRDTPAHEEWRALMPARFAIIDDLLM